MMSSANRFPHATRGRTSQQVVSSPATVQRHPLLVMAKRQGWLNDEQIIDIQNHAKVEGLDIEESLIELEVLRPIELECLRGLTAPLTYAPGYEILDVIGFGGMGIVFYARQRALDRLVALKTLANPRFGGNASQARFRREAEAIGRLKHPNIIGAYDYGRCSSFAYLAMEFVDGIDLERWITENGPMSEMQGWSVARQICAGLAHAKEQGITHRDLKPSNLLVVDPDSNQHKVDGMPLVKIADFGLAIQNDSYAHRDRVTATHVALGSPPYMAPEQLEGGPIDHLTDIYCLGATLLHLFTGRVPFDGMPTAQVITQKISKIPPNIDSQLASHSDASRKLLRILLSPDRSKRCGDYRQLVAKIDKVLNADRTATRPVMLGVKRRSDQLADHNVLSNDDHLEPLEEFDRLNQVVDLSVDDPLLGTRRLQKSVTRFNTDRLAKSTAIGGGMLVLGFVATIGIAQLAQFLLTNVPSDSANANTVAESNRPAGASMATTTIQPASVAETDAHERLNSVVENVSSEANGDDAEAGTHLGADATDLAESNSSIFGSQDSPAIAEDVAVPLSEFALRENESATQVDGFDATSVHPHSLGDDVARGEDELVAAADIPEEDIDDHPEIASIVQPPLIMHHPVPDPQLEVAQNVNNGLGFNGLGFNGQGADPHQVQAAQIFFVDPGPIMNDPASASPDWMPPPPKPHRGGGHRPPRRGR